MDKPQDLDAALRKAYRFLRQQDPHLRAHAFWLWRRQHGSRPSTFMVAGDGTCWRFDKYALLAELRLLIARNFPVRFLANFDL